MNGHGLRKMPSAGGLFGTLKEMMIVTTEPDEMEQDESALGDLEEENEEEPGEYEDGELPEWARRERFNDDWLGGYAWNGRRVVLTRILAPLLQVVFTQCSPRTSRNHSYPISLHISSRMPTDYPFSRDSQMDSCYALGIMRLSGRVGHLGGSLELRVSMILLRWRRGIRSQKRERRRR